MNEDMWIQVAWAIVLGAIKNPEKKAKLKKAIRKLVVSGIAAFAGDPDFSKESLFPQG